jgi:hypothetical protein
MPDPATHANNVTNITAPPAVAVGASFAGITLWPFLVALAAGAVALIYMGRMKPIDSLKSVFGSSLIGGSISQLSAWPVLLVLTKRMPELQPWADVAQVPMTIALAIVIGLLCQKVIPALLDRAERTARGDTDGGNADA